MTAKQRTSTDIEYQRKINSLKNMYFNRYLMIRYFLAILLFANFYWALYTMGSMIMILPVALMALAVMPCVESFQSYGAATSSMKWTKRYYKVQLLVNGCLLVMIWTSLFQRLYPFFSDTMMSKALACVILIIGGGMAFACMQRLAKIEAQSDAQYNRIKQLEKACNIHL